MPGKSVLLLFLLLYEAGAAQMPVYNKAALDTLYGIIDKKTIAKPFAEMYIQSIAISNIYLHTLTAPQKEFITKFSSSFSNLFFEADRNFVSQKTIPKSWQFYYGNHNLNDLQYKFAGLNAHVNGDIWQALVTAHCYDSILRYRKTVINFQRSFDVFFDSIYKTTFAYKKLQLLHRLTLGLDKHIGKKMVYRWRKRQVALALLWYSNNKKFFRVRKRIDNKMRRLNRFALKWIK
jgi:Family of unknown function (DUF5995)